MWDLCAADDEERATWTKAIYKALGVEIPEG